MRRKLRKIINEIRCFIRYVLNYNKYFQFFSVRKKDHSYGNEWHKCSFHFKMDEVGTQIDDFRITKGFNIEQK